MEGNETGRQCIRVDIEVRWIASPLVPKVKEMGFSGFEIAMFDPADLATTEIRRAFEAADLECTVCAILPPGINPISPDSAIRKKSLQHLMRCIETSSALGAQLLGGPLYAPIGYLPEHRPTQGRMVLGC